MLGGLDWWMIYPSAAICTLMAIVMIVFTVFGVTVIPGGEDADCSEDPY